MSTIQKEVINNQEFEFLWEESARGAIGFKDKKFYDLEDLVAACPSLADLSNLKQFVHIANFLFTGVDFTIIEDPLEYQARYRKNRDSLLTKEYGFYDVSALRDPFVENGNLVFFAERASSGVPYKVTCQFPYAGKGADYSLLKRI